MKSKNSAKKYIALIYFLISPLLAAIVVIFISFVLVLIYGPHPECGHNPAVGSCDLVGSSLNSAAWLAVPGFFVWPIILLIGLIIIRKN